MDIWIRETFLNESHSQKLPIHQNFLFWNPLQLIFTCSPQKSHHSSLAHRVLFNYTLIEWLNTSTKELLMEIKCKALIVSDTSIKWLTKGIITDTLTFSFSVGSVARDFFKRLKVLSLQQKRFPQRKQLWKSLRINNSPLSMTTHFVL